MQHNKTSSSLNVVTNREEGDVMVLSSNGKKASSKGKFDKKKASSGIDNAIDLKPMKFDADLTAELIIRIITVYSSSSLQKEKNNNSTVSASSASSSSTCGDAILVFLSGVQAIEKVNRALRQRSIVQSMKVQVDTYCYDISTYLPHLPTSLPHLPTYLPLHTCWGIYAGTHAPRLSPS
jgi:hypothetical protein